MEKRNGNFIGKKDIDFTNDQINDILGIKCRVQEIFKDKCACVRFRENEHSEHGSVVTELELTLKRRGGVQRSGRTKAKHRIYVESPVIHILFHNQNGLVKSGSTEREKQACVYISTHGFERRGYRKKTWLTYGEYISFGYGYEVETLWEDAIQPALKQIYKDYNLILI